MRRLAERLRVRVRDVRDSEKGISLLFVTISLVVLVGMVAFAVDIGALYQERRELQNGADAAAIAIAEDCALGAQPCTQAQAVLTAESFADSNAGDLVSAVDTVVLDTTAKTVEVATSTETSSGGSIFRPFFAKVVGFNGTTVHADAAAAWGYLKSKTTIPLIISYCEWERETVDGADYPTPVPPPWSPPPADGGLHGLNEPTGSPPWQGAAPALLKFHTGNNQADDCAAQAGQDTDGDGRLPGGFGWLKDTNGGNDCLVPLEKGVFAPEDPGSAPTTGCNAATLKALIYQKEIQIPWFIDSNDLGGANGEYKVHDFVSFYVTGYNFGGQFKEPGSGPCSGSVRCLEGYFKHGKSNDGEIGGTGGVIVVKFTK